mmetsp:Transcript_70643/g.196514  ORF Transcript_70643/g.196514 Transcript_70643/m.196514 type:complete len:366 (-) Transcript_70643:145-1242(-)
MMAFPAPRCQVHHAPAPSPLWVFSEKGSIQSDSNNGDLSCYTDTLERLPRFLSQPLSPCSPTSSAVRYADSAETLLFFDWDETLFPTAQIFDVWGLPTIPTNLGAELSAQQQEAMETWRKALREYLAASRTLGKCVIITNARRPWVHDCLDRFAPELHEYINDEPDGIKVVYARDRSSSKSHKMRMRPVRQIFLEGKDREIDEQEEELTRAKYEAMKKEAKAFYSRHPKQTWKNILSIGDMRYERDALQELTFLRMSPRRERIRTKTIILPTRPAVTEITLRLKFSCLMLPAFVHYNGDIDVDLSTALDPLQSLADALQMPELTSVSFPLYAWGLDKPPLEHEVDDGLAAVAIVVHNCICESICG